DRMGGLRPLIGPSSAFGLVVTAASATIAASWGTRMFREDIPFTSFYDTLITLLVLLPTIALCPLLVFSGQLRRLRRRAILEYGAFATRFCHRFERTWLWPGRQEPMATSDIPDISSLCDLGGSYE